MPRNAEVTEFDAPDVKNIVFARALRSSILYKQMKGRGTRLCEDIDKRYLTIFDYVGAAHLEDTEFDGHKANTQKPESPSQSKKKAGEPSDKPVGDGITVIIAREHNLTCASPTAGKSRSMTIGNNPKKSFVAARQPASRIFSSFVGAHRQRTLVAHLTGGNREALDDLSDAVDERDGVDDVLRSTPATMRMSPAERR